VAAASHAALRLTVYDHARMDAHTRVRKWARTATLDKSLDDASLRFIYWHAGAFDVFQFGPIGQRRVIPADFDHSQQLAEELIH
jgi:hypothetical protein